MSTPPPSRHPTAPPARPPRDRVEAHGNHIVEIARATFGTQFAELTSDPCGVLDNWNDVDFRLVPETAPPQRDTLAADGTACSVAGAYIESTDPTLRPIIQVARSPVAGRRSFTALHELGHHLQRTNLELAKTLWAETNIALLEDLACDAFAAAVLLPDTLVNAAITAAGPTAPNILDLYALGNASRSAVIVRAAQRLPAPGHVLLLNPDGTVLFSSPHGLPPLAPGRDQSRVDTIARGLRTGSSRGRGRFFYRDGITGDELFIQTANMDGYLLVVAVTDSAPWEGFTLPSKDVGPRAGTYECDNDGCAATYVSWEPRCPRCHVPPCTDCGHCNCKTQAAERTCMTCFEVKAAAGFVGDRCADCND